MPKESLRDAVLIRGHHTSPEPQTQWPERQKEQVYNGISRAEPSDRTREELVSLAR
jgi:hypothetical protein